MPRFAHASRPLSPRATRPGPAFLPVLFAWVAFCMLACACATVRAATFDPNQAGLSGSWANAATDGQGFVFDVVEDFHGEGRALIFGGWFTYDTDVAGGVRWYTVQGELARQGASTMAIYQTLGGSFDSPQPATTQAVGEFSIEFTDCTHANASYRFDDGRTGDLPLARLLGNATCMPGASTPAAPGSAAWSGAWADPTNGGQGLVLEFNPDQQLMFGAWYAFARGAAANAGAAGQDWYTLQAGVPAGATRIADIGIYATRGGRFDAHAATTTTRVGTVQLDMQDCTHATLAYEFTAGALAGSQGTLALLRITPPPAGCAAQPPVSLPAIGSWKGTKANGEAFHIVIPDPDSYLIIFSSNNADRRLAYGNIDITGDQFSSPAQGISFGLRNAPSEGRYRAPPVLFEGTFQRGGPMQSILTTTITEAQSEDEYLDAHWDAGFDTPTRLADVAGHHSGILGVVQNGRSASFEVAVDGQVTGTAGSCQFEGRLEASDSGLFGWTLRGTSAGCTFGTTALHGVAWYDRSQNRLRAYTPWAQGTNVAYLVSTRD